MKLQILQRSICLSAAMAMATVVLAEDKLIVTGMDSKQTEVNLADISRITFDGGKMTIASVSGDKEFQLSELENLTFDLSLSAIENVEASLNPDISISVQGGIMSVLAPADIPLTVAVYDLKGHLMVRKNGPESVSIDFNPMASGIYIVRANGKTIKFTR